MEHKYLYRALRRVEIEAGYKLIPKGTMEFIADPRLDLDVFPMQFGSETNAIRHHQWCTSSTKSGQILVKRIERLQATLFTLGEYAKPTK